MTSGLLVVGTFSLLIAATAAIDAKDYLMRRKFHGDGTYYGDGGWEGGNCAIRSPRPNFYKRYVPIAINNKQYEGMCGACIEFWGDGKGLGANPIVGRKMGVIVDRCPECKYGDIDLSMAGDGRWKVSWRVVPCAGDSKISFQFEGSNQFYWKLQPRGMRSPARSVNVGGVEAYRTQDNHWIAQKNFKPPVKVVVITVLGGKYVSYLSRWHGVVYGSAMSGKRRRRTRNNRNKGGKHKRRRGKCVRKWMPCTGPNNKSGTSRCCGNWWCVRTSVKGFIGNRCEPPKIRRKPRKCVRKWYPCSGPMNKSGTSRCCGGWWCVGTNAKGFVGKRCEPPRKVKAAGKCRRHYSSCGRYQKWKTKTGKRYPKPHCCQRGSSCVWTRTRRYTGFRCVPY